LAEVDRILVSECYQGLPAVRVQKIGTSVLSHSFFQNSPSSKSGDRGEDLAGGFEKNPTGRAWARRYDLNKCFDSLLGSCFDREMIVICTVGFKRPTA